jgi:hypothetical protein
MKRSSIIMLIVAGVLLIYLATIYISISSTSKPQLTQQDAVTLLNGLAKAFDTSSTEGVLSYAAPDAKVAGKELDDIRQLLRRGFAAMKDPHVEFANLNYEKRDDTTVYLRFDANVVDKSPNGFNGGGTVYSQRMGFTVRRILMPKLGGIMHTYEWKVTDVDAPKLPNADGT